MCIVQRRASLNCKNVHDKARAKSFDSPSRRNKVRHVAVVGFRCMFRASLLMYSMTVQ
jgi:hypothetical protein